MANGAAEKEAVGWFVRQRDPAHADWPAFTAWLEADPAHAAAYDWVAIADAAMTEALAARPLAADRPDAAPANDNAPGFFRRYGAVAAALLVAVSAWPVYRVAVPTYAVETALGEQRSVTLDDGTVIDLNGGTRVTLDRRNPRIATLESGEAVFRVTHDPADPFTVVSGDMRLRDVGTVFNVAREDGRAEVSVAEGAVMFDPDRAALLLRAGQRLHIAHSGAAPVVTRVDPATVAGWKTGRLDFTATPLSDIAPDLSRALGAPIAVDPAIADRTFTGTILIDGKDKAAIEKIAILMGVSARKVGEEWRLTAN
ncbi:FecR domain-containing protein [Sphingopyxis sp.]|jgi:transmembrane sensor|uniref:FecR family protein n=1 Tax=Sphingopyxis sp. TaxID=1908224 RepID=UPI00311EB22D